MKINTWIKYTEDYLPKKRNKKLRYRECEDYIDVELREISFKNVKKKYSVEDRVYYEYNNKLYKKAVSRDVSALEIDNPIENLKYCYEKCSFFFGFGENDKREKMIDKARENIEKYLLIDGELYISTFRPFYRIYSFGGTGFSGSVCLSICDSKFQFLPNADFVFESNNREKALNCAINNALDRKNIESIDEIKRTPIIVEY